MMSDIERAIIERYLDYPCPNCGQEKLFVDIQYNFKTNDTPVVSVECNNCLELDSYRVETFSHGFLNALHQDDD